jgi:CBS domain-containing protein/sugar-specific transcriptional regulator TrmB
LSQERALKVLLDIGFTRMDSQVYMFLAKKGPQKGRDIFKGLKISKPQLYRSLKTLQSKGIVSATFERPTRFFAVPFEKALDMFIKAKTEEVQRIQQNKDQILSDWRSVEIRENIDTSARFTIIVGRNYVYAKILQMMKETKSQLSIMSTVQGLVRAYESGLFDMTVGQALKSKIQFRFLTQLSHKNLEAMKSLLKRKLNNGSFIEGRDVDSGLRVFPGLVIRDEEEIVFLIKPLTSTSSAEQEDTALWTNSKGLVGAFKEFFEELWRNSTDINKRIVEIETGKPAPETYVIKDAETAHTKYVEIMESAKEEITIMTSAKGLVRCWKNRQKLKEWTERGTSIRIMAPLTSENLRAARQLSRCCAVRHVSMNYLRTTVVDGRHLFQFKTPSPEMENLETKIYFENTFYTNDLGYVDRMKDMLSDIWKSGSDLSAVTLKSITRIPAHTVSPSHSASAIAKTMTKKNVGSVIVTEGKKLLGIITEKDILDRVINAQKDPAKTFAKDIMSTPLVTINHHQTSKEALEVMRKNNIRRLAVVRGTKLVGVVTERRVLGSPSALTQTN